MDANREKETARAETAGGGTPIQQETEQETLLIPGKPPFVTEPLRSERTWTLEGIPVLRAEVSLTVPEGKTWGRIRWFYRTQSRAFLRYCQRELLPWAEAEGRLSLEYSTPVHCFQAELSCQETYRRGRLWSLYTQVREDAAPGPASLRRWGDIWDLRTGLPVPASAFFRPREHWKRQAADAASAEILRQEEQGVSRFYPDWRRRLRRHFHARNCYLTPEGFAFFWPMYALAPAPEGVPVFLLPYSGEPPLEPVW